MRVVILAGGMGTRLPEETTARPKSMVEIGGQPILRHIINRNAQHGQNEIQIALGELSDFFTDGSRDRRQMIGNRSTRHAPARLLSRGELLQPTIEPSKKIPVSCPTVHRSDACAEDRLMRSFNRSTRRPTCW